MNSQKKLYELPECIKCIQLSHINDGNNIQDQYTGLGMQRQYAVNINDAVNDVVNTNDTNSGMIVNTNGGIEWRWF